jgi:hypothetical protein
LASSKYALLFVIKLKNQHILVRVLGSTMTVYVEIYIPYK